MADRLCVALAVLGVLLAAIGVAALREARRERRIAAALYRMARAVLAMEASCPREGGENARGGERLHHDPADP